MEVFFDEGTRGDDILQKLDTLPSGHIYYKKQTIEGIDWYFFSDKPIVLVDIHRLLNINQPDCKHDWENTTGKCEDCGHQR